jgi:hypothetical protein
MLSIPLLPLLAALAWTPSPVQADTAVARIRREFAAVNAILPRCSRQTLDIWGQSAEGGSLETYRCGGEIRKLVATWYGETGQAREEWYLTGERPFFFFSTELRYDRPFGRIVRRAEERVYLRGGEMVRWIGDDGRARGTTSDEARARLAEIRESVDDLLDRARTGRTEAK